MPFLGYLTIALVLFAAFVPGAIISYIKEEVKKGNWVDQEPVATVTSKIDETKVIVNEMNSTSLIDGFYSRVSEKDLNRVETIHNT